jgi:hypothetical protein
MFKILQDNGVALFFACKREGGRAKLRPGESTRRTLPLMHIGDSTHPDCATLVGPLFRKRERGRLQLFLIF